MGMFFRQKIPYLLLGIGIGILMTNIVYSLYPKVEYKEYSQEEIIRKAEELGMVFLKEAIKVEKPVGDEKAPETDTKEVQFVIKKGDYLGRIANNLQEAGIIEDKDSFIKYVKEKGLDKRFRVGSYKLSPGMAYDEILDILQKRKK